MSKVILYHGTSACKARKIIEEGFRTDTKKNWKVKSSKGYIYLSVAYAPFYAMNATTGDKLALVKVQIEEKDLYPDDDFLMFCLKKPVYTQEDLAEISLSSNKKLWKDSIKHMGSVAARPSKIEVLGLRTFNSKGLIMKCDPCISPINFLIMGDYYRRLTEWIYEGKDIKDFSFEENMIGVKYG